MSTERPSAPPPVDSTTPANAAGEAPSSAAAPPRRRRLVLFGVIAAIALILDVVSKVVVVAELADRAPVRLLGGALYVQEVRNPGAAFSQGTSFTIVITAIVIVIVLVLLRTARRLRSVGWAVALGLILGGALGNLTDRLFRAPSVGRGRVVDWISVFGPNGEKYPIFNLADSAVTVGAVIVAILALRGIGLDGRRAEKTPKAASTRNAPSAPHHADHDAPSAPRPATHDAPSTRDAPSGPHQAGSRPAGERSTAVPKAGATSEPASGADPTVKDPLPPEPS